MKYLYQWFLIPYRKISKLQKYKLINCTKDILKGNILIGLEKEYPNVREWYEKKVLPGLETGEREIILACKFTNNITLDSPIEILGYVILKKTLNEKKICTFRVKKEYQHLGIGKKLMKASFEFLETQKPMITVSEDHIKEFESLLKRYKFNLIEKIDNLYVAGKTEYIYHKKWEVEN